MAQLLTPVPTVTAQSTLAGKSAQDALDESLFWESDDAMSVAVVWIKFDFGEQVTLDEVQWAYPSSSKVAPSVKLETSNNDTDWTEVDTWSGLVAWSSTLTFTNPETARYFRFTETTLQASHWALFQVDFFGGLPSGNWNNGLWVPGQPLTTG